MKILGSTRAECYRFDAEGGTFRTARVDRRRLYTIRKAVLYLELVYDVQTSVEVLREAVAVGDLGCHVLKTSAVKAPPRILVRCLDPSELYFTALQLDRSDWLWMEALLMRTEHEQGPYRAAVVRAALRHPGPRPTVDVDAGDGTETLQ